LLGLDTRSADLLLLRTRLTQNNLNRDQKKINNKRRRQTTASTLIEENFYISAKIYRDILKTIEKL